MTYFEYELGGPICFFHLSRYLAELVIKYLFVIFLPSLSPTMMVFLSVNFGAAILKEPVEQIQILKRSWQKPGRYTIDEAQPKQSTLHPT